VEAAAQARACQREHARHEGREATWTAVTDRTHAQGELSEARQAETTLLHAYVDKLLGNVSALAGAVCVGVVV
jgi:hypothetical protein